MTLAPRIEGIMPARSSGAQFVQALRQRVAIGLLSGRLHFRSNYRVIEEGPGVLRVRVANYSTAVNVGLNDLELRLSSSDSVHFRRQYWRWAPYVFGLGGVLGLTGLVLLLMLDVRGYISRHATASLPGFSIDQKVGMAWLMVLFWGIAWPWLLIALHKRPLRRLVERLVGEVDAHATSQ